VGHNYTLPTIKLLFATARSCAYPGCPVPLVFEDADRGVRSVAVQIAHIRSPKSTGPRHDPDYPSDKLNSDENLLLLCNRHHHPVDGSESKYTIEELLEWKKNQVTDGGGFLVEDEDIPSLAASLQASLDELVKATRLYLEVRLVGGRLSQTDPVQVVRIDLDIFEEFGSRGDSQGLFRPGRWIGVETENRGSVGTEVEAAGIDFDLGPDRPDPWQYTFPANTLTPWQFPCRVDGHSSRRWFNDEDSIRTFSDWLFKVHGSGPRRFRAWVRLGNGDRATGEWIAREELPIWEPGVGKAELRVRYAEVTKPRR
jgi:hypothetical protein